jgi:hypothetical protein
MPGEPSTSEGAVDEPPPAKAGELLHDARDLPVGEVEHP